MIYIIQTNTVLDNENQPRDFQSVMFKYSSWEEYKNDLLSEEIQSSLIIGTMMGNIKPRMAKVEKVIIDDDCHLECIIDNGFVRTNIKAYKVEECNFKNLL